MNVNDLLILLHKLDPEAVVVLSSDGEGNTFSPVAGSAAKYYYVPEFSGSGSLYELDEGETPEQFKETFPNAQKAVVLYPVS